MHHNLKFAILRYFPNVISDASVAFGILGHEVGTGTFADAKFLHAWESILRVDPTADIEALSSLTTEIQNEWPKCSETNDPSENVLGRIFELCSSSGNFLPFFRSKN